MTRMLLARRWLLAAASVSCCVIALALVGQEPLVSRACVACASGSNVSCDPGWHKAWDDGDDKVWAGETHSNCKCCSCTTSHGSCEIEGEFTTAELVDAVDTAVVEDNSATLARVLSEYRNRVSVNTDRSAVQITGCSGAVVAHLSISDSLMKSVESLTGSDQDSLPADR